MVYRSTTYYNHADQTKVIDKITAFLIVNNYNFVAKRLKKPIRNNDVSIGVTGMTMEQYREYRSFLAKVGG